MRLVGQLGLLGAFVATGYAAFACIAGWSLRHRGVQRSGIVAAALGATLLTLAICVLAFALLGKDFRFAYVAQYSSQLLPWHYTLSALWVGQAGSLLLWAWLCGLLALVFYITAGRSQLSLRVPATGLLMGFCCFLIATMIFAADPMAASLAAPRDGAGLSPLLQHPAMLFHPPIVFLGYTLWAIPFALAATALASGQLDHQWVRVARPWALLAWGVLGGGILLGAEWAYEELGWGGYWSWDPVENGSLMPWLTGTALIHALMAWQCRGVLKKTAAALAIATFGLCNFATFLTRSGIFSSLHAFSQSPIGWLFLILMVALAVSGAVLIVRRRALLVAETPIVSILSREALILVCIVALVVLALATLLGTLSVALSGAIVGRRIIVGTDYYNSLLVPVGLLVLAMTALAPLVRWGGPPRPPQRKAILVAATLSLSGAVVPFAVGARHPIVLAVAILTLLAALALAAAVLLDAQHRRSARGWLSLVDSLRKGRRQYAGFLVHLGLFCLAVGIAGSSLGTQRHDAALREGETVEWAGWSVRLIALVPRSLPDRRVVEAQLEVSRAGGPAILLTPAQHLHELQQEWTTEVAIHSSWRGDFYTILRGSEGEGRVGLTFVKNPMMRWLWLGGVIMGLGVVVRLWPSRVLWRRANARPAAHADADLRLPQLGMTTRQEVSVHESPHANDSGAVPRPHSSPARRAEREPQCEARR